MSRDLAQDETKYGDEFVTGFAPEPIRVVYVQPGRHVARFGPADLVVFLPATVIDGQAEPERRALAVPEVEGRS